MTTERTRTRIKLGLGEGISAVAVVVLLMATCSFTCDQELAGNVGNNFFSVRCQPR